MSRKVITYILAVCFAIINFPLKAAADTDAKSMTNIKELIVKHSIEMGLDPSLALSIAKTESNFCHEKKSRYGAVGVFQLLPSTAKELGYNPYQIQENIKGGIEYYKMMYKIFGTTELALAAYNAGPGNVKKYKGMPPFNETKKFVSAIMSDYKEAKINPDPAIANYNNAIKEISNEIAEKDFRMEQEAILKAYLSNQGI